MRLVPRHWHTETWICSIRGHVTPAADVVRLRPEDRTLGVDMPDGLRFARCLRCDAWLPAEAPEAGTGAPDVLPPVDELDKPRRGTALEDAVVLRLIAIDRAVHSVLFGALALVLLVVELRLPAIQAWAESIRDGLTTAVDESARGGSHAVLNRQLERLADLRGDEVKVLLLTAAVYAVVEGVEAVGLWRERRWAEYLTVVATLGFVPFEVRELLNRVTVLRVAALVVNLAILVWLVWSKHLFGVRGGAATLEARTDWERVLSGPVEPGAAPPRVATTPQT